MVIRSGGDRFIVRIPVADDGTVEVPRNDQRQLIVPCATPLAEVDHWPCTVDAARLLSWTIGSSSQSTGCLFLSLSTTTTRRRTEPATIRRSPSVFGVDRSSVTDLKIFRDVYYTSALGSMPRHPHGVTRALSAR